MKIILGERRCGKSTDILRMALEANGILIVASLQRKRSLAAANRDNARLSLFIRHNVLTAHELRSAKYLPQGTLAFVDDSTDVLRALLNAPLTLAGITVDTTTCDVTNLEVTRDRVARHTKRRGKKEPPTDTKRKIRA